jgi:hypothetical protein
MPIRLFAISALVFIGLTIQSSIAAEGQDYPGLGRIVGYKIDHREDRRFDRHNFPLPGRQMPIEGQLVTIRYELNGSEPAASSVEIVRSYKTVIDALSGEILQYQEDGGTGCFVARYTKDSQNTFVQLDIYNGGEIYDLTVVEERPFRPMIEQSAPQSKP